MINYKEMYFNSVYEPKINNYSPVNLTDQYVRESFKFYLTNALEDIKKDVKGIEESNKELAILMEKDIPFLNKRINKVADKIRGAILVERNTTSMIYSTIVPITPQYINNTTTTATVKDSVIFGISDYKIDREDITPLDFKSVIFNNLSIKNVKKDILRDVNISNMSHNTLPFEFTVKLDGLLSNNSLLILDLKDNAILDIYINNNLSQERVLSNYFSIPVDINTNSVTFRSYPTLHKSSDLYINILGISNLMYQEDTIYETKSIGIAENLTHLVLDTCDNASDSNVDIKYYLSVNDKEYERVNTVQSYSNKDNSVQSVISLSKDSELDLLSLNGVKKTEGDIQYILPDEIQNQVDFELDVYFPKTDYDTRRLSSLYLLIKEDIELDKNTLTDSDIYIDNELKDSGTIVLYKGIRKIIFNDLSYNYLYLENIIGKENIFSYKLTKPIYNKNGYKYVSLNSIDLLDGFNSPDINTIYIKNTNKQVYVSNIKIKVELSSNDKKTVPYISRFLIRGI